MLLENTLNAGFRYTKTGGMHLRLFDVASLTPGKDTLAAAVPCIESGMARGGAGAGFSLDIRVTCAAGEE